MAKIEIKKEIIEQIQWQNSIPQTLKNTLDKYCKEAFDYKVYRTTEYDIFNHLSGNRSLCSVKAIMDSVEAVGYIDEPIIVNEKLEVIDGQNRLEACRNLGHPVLFHIINGIGIDEAIQLNIGQRNWKLLDYVKSYSEQGIESYSKLLKYYLVLPIDFKVILSISNNTVGDSYYGYGASIKNGSYVMGKKEEDILEDRINFLADNIDLIDKLTGRKRLVYTAIAFCIGVKGVDRKRLLRIIEKQYANIAPIDDPIRYLIQMSDFYNKSLKAKRIFFENEYRLQTGK